MKDNEFEVGDRVNFEGLESDPGTVTKVKEDGIVVQWDSGWTQIYSGEKMVVLHRPEQPTPENDRPAGKPAPEDEKLKHLFASFMDKAANGVFDPSSGNKFLEHSSAWAAAALEVSKAMTQG